MLEMPDFMPIFLFSIYHHTGFHLLTYFLSRLSLNFDGFHKTKNEKNCLRPCNICIIYFVVGMFGLELLHTLQKF